MSGQGPTKVAVVQAASAIFDSEKTLEKVTKLAKEAADAGAKLVLFPEAFLGGYPHFLDFGKPGTTNPQCRETFQRYWNSAVEIPGPIVTQLENIAKANKIHMVVGAIERELATLYCVTIFITDEGQFVGKHRKLVPTTAERLVWGRGDGSTLPVFDWPMGKVGSVICWENYMPLLRVTMYSKGIQIYLAPNADDTDGWIHSMQHIALEGRCFVLACNQFIRKSDYPADLVESVDCKNDVVSRGGSVIVNPLGEILQGPNYTGEGILYADIDLADTIRGKFDLDSVGHYSRPDIFTLNVIEKKNSNVTIEVRESEPQAAEEKVSQSAPEENVSSTVEEKVPAPTATEEQVAPPAEEKVPTAEENAQAPTVEAQVPTTVEEQAPAAAAEEKPPQTADDKVPTTVEQNVSQAVEDETLQNNLKNLNLSQ